MNSSTPPDPVVKADVFRELDGRSLARHAADHLKALIVSGSLAPGDRLPPERELALHLGVSRPTLREAIGALVIVGLLESRQGAGTFVVGNAEEAVKTGSPNSTTVSISIEEDPLGSLFELRLLLEPTAAERAASRASEAELSQLRTLLDEMGGVRGDREQFIRLDAEFHRLIHVAAGSTLISSMLERISALGFRSRTLSVQNDDVPQRTVADHEAILDALKARDAFAAKAAMTAHLVHIRSVLVGQAT